MATNAGSKTIAPYGAWSSPITSDLLVQKNISIASIHPLVSPNGSRIVYSEARPSENGRTALILRDVDSNEQDGRDLTGGKYNARCGVHEYGGGAAVELPDSGLLFTDFGSRRVYRVGQAEGQEPVPVTPENPAHRYGDFHPHPYHSHLFLSILEDHTVDEPSKVINTLVCVDMRSQKVHTVASGYDFYSSPRFSPDGNAVAWVCWRHPSMPWWGTELHVAAFDAGENAATPQFAGSHIVAGGQGKEALGEPNWGVGDGEWGAKTLFFSSDRTGFSNVYRVTVESTHGGSEVAVSKVEPVLKEPVQADTQTPAWTLGNSTYTILSGTHLLCTLIYGGYDTLALVSLPNGTLTRLDTPYVQVSKLRAISSTRVVFYGVRNDAPPAVILLDLTPALKNGATKLEGVEIKRSSDVIADGTVGKEWISVAEQVEFPTELPDGSPTTAHALLYPPCNPNFSAPKGTAPPCIITVHGGPTTSAPAGLNLQYLYWTSRGWMICAVNYGGSTGLGREYMERLSNSWGIVDVRDCVAAAEWLGSSTSIATQSSSREGASSVADQLKYVTEKHQPSGAVEITIKNEKAGWSVMDLGAATLIAAAGALSSSFDARVAVAAGGLAWLWTKLTQVQSETATAIPSVGLQLTTQRGLVLPSLRSIFSRSSRSSKSEEPTQRVWTTSKQTTLIPRDRMLDLFVNEGFRRWAAISYLAVATKLPPSEVGVDAEKATEQKEGKLAVLFPNLLPRLPVLERAYRSLYPALFNAAPSSSLPIRSSSSATFAAASSRADPKKIVISGGSSGGYTVLSALCLYPHAFAAGTSKYGICDLEMLAKDSHKFESQYEAGLLGGHPWEIPQVYHDRSPLYMASSIRSPVLVLQGKEDKVVPPNQSEAIVAKIKENKGKVRYLEFEGEGHGFRQAANMRKAIEEERKWYEEVLGLQEVKAGTQ